MKNKSFAILTLLAFGACQKNTNPNVYCQKPFAVVEETYVHKYGFEVQPEEWQTRGEHGQKISTLNSGVTVCQNYSFGELDGESSYTYPYSSTIETIQTFNKGQLIADEVRYMGDNPKKRSEYAGTKRKVTHWYENGVPQSIEEYNGDKMVKGDYFNISHQIDAQVISGNGTRVNRDPFGQTQSKDTFENGDMIERISFWNNGTPKEMLPYKNGIVHGLRRTFYVGGEPDKVETWVDGRQNGVTVVYQNGEKYAEVPYANDLKSGIEKRFRNGEELFEEITWLDGYESGPSRNFKQKTKLPSGI